MQKHYVIFVIMISVVIMAGTFDCNNDTPRVINISALAFTARSNPAGEEGYCNFEIYDLAVLGQQNGGRMSGVCTYFANVPFTEVEGEVLKFTVHFRDNSIESDLTARLLAKRFATTDIFEPPIILAELASSGREDDLQVLSTTDISNPDIDLSSFYYYVELSLNGLAAVGVQIEYK